MTRPPKPDNCKLARTKPIPAERGAGETTQARLDLLAEPGDGCGDALRQGASPEPAGGSIGAPVALDGASAIAGLSAGQGGPALHLGLLEGQVEVRQQAE